jgi:uncharacterized repeat protein (TIGR02543 family)
MKRLVAVIVLLVAILIVAVQPDIKERSQYSVVFFSNGGTPIKTLVLESNAQVLEPKEPTRQSSTFAGWYTSLDFKDDELFDFSSRISKSMTLYAKWDVETYTIVYELGNEGSWPNEEAKNLFLTTFNFDSPIIYLDHGTSNAPKHSSGARFRGWRTISQSDFNALTPAEQGEYPMIGSINPKNDLELFDDNNTLVLYAYYRGL